MIKINLATRKQSGGAGGEGKSAKKPGGIGVDGLRDFPFRKVAVPVAVGLIASYALDNYKETELKAQDAEVARVIALGVKWKTEVTRYKEYEAVKKSLDEDETTIRTKLDTITKLNADRSAGSRLLISIANSVPKDVWLEDFRTTKADVKFKGGALGFTLVSDFMKNLNENAFFSQVELSNSNSKSKTDPDSDITTFEINAKWR